MNTVTKTYMRFPLARRIEHWIMMLFYPHAFNPKKNCSNKLRHALLQTSKVMRKTQPHKFISSVVIAMVDGVDRHFLHD